MSGSLGPNPPNAGRNITTNGTDWLWTVFALELVSTAGMAAWSFTRPKGTRFFHNIALIMLATATIAYFSMASDLGATPILTEFGTRTTRQIWYVRYIYYFINFPLLLILLQFATGLSLSDILTTAFFAWFVVVNALVGALVSSSYKWGYFVFGLFALFWIWTSLLAHGSRTTFNAGQGVRDGYVRGAGFFVFISMLYPIAWGVSEGGNRISPSSEMVFYGILDLILGPLFLYYFIFGLRNVDYAAFGFHSGKYTDGAAPVGRAGAPAMTSTAAPGASAGTAAPASVPVADNATHV